jgi:SAM-dependent methyltransferase
MKKYFGIFEDLVNQHSSYVNEQEFYYEDTVEFYDLLSISYDDFSFFYRMANVYGGPILDLCCGSGRLLIPMAKKGFDVTGVDLSKDMLSQLDMLLNSRYRRIKNNVSLFQQDMANLKLPKTYNFIMLGATSIRLLPGSFTDFFNQIYLLLNKGGCFCFNFENLPDKCDFNEEMGDMVTANLLDKDRRLCIVLMQRLINYPEKCATVNMAKILPSTMEKILLTYAQYRTFGKKDIEKAVVESNFQGNEFIHSDTGYFCKLIK